MAYMEELGRRAKEAAKQTQSLTQQEKNQGLRRIASKLRGRASYILEENAKDVAAAREAGMKESLVDRLKLTEERIDGMAVGLEQIADLDDPVGEFLSVKNRPNGLRVGQKRVPLGVVGIIYESRPNVTADAFGLCFKTGNAVMLRGGSDAIHSNLAIVQVIHEGLAEISLPEDALVFVEKTDREYVDEMMKLRGYIDVLIPRGGSGLIRRTVENSTVPVIETGTGNCHIYVDEYADLAMAVEIIDNAKTQRTGVCNACESLVIHAAVAETVIPMICQRLMAKGVEIRGDETARAVCGQIHPAQEEDWGREYLDLIISVKVTPSIEEAVEHINTYNTGHSEAIITDNYWNANFFQEKVDAAAVYVNASTRFTDGFEFGFGAEIGISTQKLHARGPMGLTALTTTKYVIFGDGQTRK